MNRVLDFEVAQGHAFAKFKDVANRLGSGLASVGQPLPQSVERLIQGFVRAMGQPGLDGFPEELFPFGL